MEAHAAAEYAPPDDVECVLGLPVWLIFYDIVHAVTVVFQSLLCDLAIYYQVLHASRLHPAAAFISTLFALSYWDPFLVSGAAKDKKRRSRKPLYAVDPAVVWAYLLDGHQIMLLVEVLRSHDVPWDMPHVPGGASTLKLFHTAMMWLDSVMRGDAAAARTLGYRTEDMWRHMLTLSVPVPAGVQCAHPLGHASFYNPIVAFGPASHMAFCSTWRHI